MTPEGHDMFMTKVDAGYVVDVITEKGEALISCGTFTDATDEQIKNAEDTVKKADTDCKEKLNNTEADIKEKVRASFNYFTIQRSLS